MSLVCQKKKGMVLIEKVKTTRVPLRISQKRFHNPTSPSNMRNFEKISCLGVSVYSFNKLNTPKEVSISLQ